MIFRLSSVPRALLYSDLFSLCFLHPGPKHALQLLVHAFVLALDDGLVAVEGGMILHDVAVSNNSAFLVQGQINSSSSSFSSLQFSMSYSSLFSILSFEGCMILHEMI